MNIINIIDFTLSNPCFVGLATIVKLNYVKITYSTWKNK